MTLPKTHQPTQVVQGHLELLLAFHVDAYRGILKVSIGIGSHDIEGVLDGMHYSSVL
jgi:hypothetical protein